MDLFDIAAKITLNTSEYEEGLKGAEGKGSSFASKLKSGLGAAAKVGGASILALVTAAVALVKKFTDGINDLGQYGDAIDKNSQKMGISAKAYQEWDFVLQHSGSSIDAMGRGMMTLSKQAESNSDAFEKLGITQEDLATLNKEDLFAKTIEGLQALGEGTERDALAAKLFGGSAKELGPLLNTSADDVAEMRKQVNELGGVMSDDAVKAAAQYQDSIQNLKTAISGIKRTFMSNFLPAVTKVSDGLTKLFSGDKTEGLKEIKNGVQDLIKELSNKLPQFLEIGFSIVQSLAQVIVENLPMLVEKGADLLLNGVIPGILDNLPAIIDAGFRIIGELAIAIGKSLPDLIPSIVEVVLQIVDTIIDNVDMMIDAAIAIITGLAEGLIKEAPRLLEKAPEIVLKLVEAIIENAPKMFDAALEIIAKLGEGIVSVFEDILQWGEDIINKIWEGIKSVWSDIVEWGGKVIDRIGEGISKAWEKVKQWGKDLIKNFWEGIKSALGWLEGNMDTVANAIKDRIGFSEPKKGPLSNFHTYAPDMMRLFAQGVIENKKMLSDTVSDAFDFSDLISAPESTYGIPALSGGFGAGEIKLYIDGDKLVGATSERMDRDLGDMQEIRARWGGRNK